MYIVTDKYGRQLVQVASLEKAKEFAVPQCRIYRINGPHTCELVK